MILQRKKNTGDNLVTNFHIHYKPTGIKTVWHWHINTYRPMEQNQEVINLCLYSNLIFDKDFKNSQWEKIGFSINGVGKTEYL